MSTLKNVEYKTEFLRGTRAGNTAKNQVVMIINTEDNHMEVFQSYTSLICKIDYNKKKITVGSKWDYSITTLKYFYQFLREYAGINSSCKKNIESAFKGRKIFVDKAQCFFDFILDENL